MFVDVELCKTSSACNTACFVESECEDPTIEEWTQDIPMFAPVPTTTAATKEA